MPREPANAFVLVPTQIARDAMPLGDDEEIVPDRAASFGVRFREHPDFSAVHRDDAQFFAQLPIESVRRIFGVFGVTADDVPDSGE